MQTIFAYLDYQHYLKDYYDEKKKDSSFFSYRYFSNKLGVDAGFLVKVLQGKMHIAVKSIYLFVDYFKFDKKESEYFELLIRYGRAVSGREIKLYFEKMLALRTVDADILDARQYEFYQKWYYSAIREVIGFFDFRGDYAALAAKLNPSISAKEAKSAVQLLMQLGLIAKDGQGAFQQTGAFIATGEKWKSAAIHSLQQETIRLAGESLDRHPKEHRDISSITISVSHKDMDEIRERVKDFRRSLLQMTNDNPADCVYQVNIQVVPLTHIEESAS